jgi:DNA polymerase-3 subunit delta'
LRFEDLMGQSASVENLRQDFQARQFVHAYLFAGPAGVGKRSLARLCVAAMYCAAGAADKPCGACEGCLRAAHGNHPDVRVLRPEKSIGVDEVRGVLAAVQVRAFLGGPKAVVVEGAERMTPQAQNCLLRTLEDPPAGTVFFLLAEALGAMLPTVRSRCRVVNLAPLSPQALAARLQAHGIPPARAALLAEAAQGSVGRALAMHADAAYWQLRERVLRLMFESESASQALAGAAALREEKARAGQVFEMLEGALCAALRGRILGQPVVPDAYPPGWARFARDVSAQAVLRLLDANIHCKKQIASNVSFQAALEMWILKLSEEWTIWQR